MIEGTASHTARSVAARHLQYERATAPFGDPEADEALTRDVAGGLTPGPGRMHEYIRGRTAFFDRVVVNSLDRGVTQVVIGGWKLRQSEDRQRSAGLLLAHATTVTDQPEIKPHHPERPHALPATPAPRRGSPPAAPPAASLAAPGKDRGSYAAIFATSDPRS